jgi:hypothetical protein
MTTSKKAKKEKAKFMDLKVPVFVNKANGQMSVVLPKKKVKKNLKHVIVRWK